jgi:hypothetical protein
MKLKHIAKQVIEEKLQHLYEVDYEEIFSPETMSLLKKQSKDELTKLGKNLMQMVRTSQLLLPEIVIAERPHIDLLEEIAKEMVTQAYPVIKYAKIKIEATIGPGKLPQGKEEEEEEEEEQPNIKLPQATLPGEKKRRIINGITQGASIRGTFAFLLFREYLDDLGDDMVNRYNELMKSVFGIYDDENAIAMMLAQLAQAQEEKGGESEADFDEETGVLTIRATAMCFPILVHEIVKGLYEILSLQGFGPDAEQNQAVVAKVDKLTNEPNDFRFGKFIYDAINKLYISGNINDERVRELFFAELYKIDDETEFVEFIENLVTNKLNPAQKKWALGTMNDLEKRLKSEDAGIYPDDEDNEDVFTEARMVPSNPGFNMAPKNLNLKIGKYNISGNEIGNKYPWNHAERKLSNATRENTINFFNTLGIKPTKIYIGLVYRGELPDEEFNQLSDFEKIDKLKTEKKAKSFYIEGNYNGTPIIIARKETRASGAGQTYLVSPYAKVIFNKVKNLPPNEILDALKIPNEGNVDEAIIKPGNTGMTIPLSSEEKKWIDTQLTDFDPGDTPPGDPNTPLEYNLIDKDGIEDNIEDEEMTPKDLEIFNSIIKKLGKSKIYAFNNGHDSKVDQHSNLRDSILRAYSLNSDNQLLIIFSDADDDGETFGAFDKNTGKYIKYSDLG